MKLSEMKTTDLFPEISVDDIEIDSGDATIMITVPKDADKNIRVIGTCSMVELTHAVNAAVQTISDNIGKAINTGHAESSYLFMLGHFSAISSILESLSEFTNKVKAQVENHAAEKDSNQLNVKGKLSN